MIGETTPVGALDAARAGLAAVNGGAPVCIVTLVGHNATDAGDIVRRMLVFDSTTRGSLGSPDLDERAAHLGARALITGISSTTDIEHDGNTCTTTVDPQRTPDDLLIVGAGHIAIPL